MPDTSAGRLDKLQIPSQSFFRWRLRKMSREELVLGGKMLPSLRLPLSAYSSTNVTCISQGCFKEYFGEIISTSFN